MGIRGRQYTPMDEPVFNKAIPGTEALAGALKDTFGAFRSGAWDYRTRGFGEL